MRHWGPSHSVESVPSSAEEVLQNTPVQRLEGGNLATGLPSGRLVTGPREFTITFKPHCKDNGTNQLDDELSGSTFDYKYKRRGRGRVALSSCRSHHSVLFTTNYILFHAVSYCNSICFRCKRIFKLSVIFHVDFHYLTPLTNKLKYWHSLCPSTLRIHKYDVMFIGPCITVIAEE